MSARKRLDHRRFIASWRLTREPEAAVREKVAEAIGREKAHAGMWDGAASRNPGIASRDVYNEKAFRLLHSQAVRQAFHLDEEDPKLRDRYGRTKLGQSMILGRRLVEAGVRFVTVYDGQFNGQLANWDSTTRRSSSRLKNDLLPPADRAFASLIEDLSDRGLLDSTLVIGMGEFGRTPKINANGGRDHWPNCYSVVLAGGGVRGGTVYGVQRQARVPIPTSIAVTPGDLAATLFWKFGIDPETGRSGDLDRPPLQARRRQAGSAACSAPDPGLDRRDFPVADRRPVQPGCEPAP